MNGKLTLYATAIVATALSVVVQVPARDFGLFHALASTQRNPADSYASWAE